LEAVKKSCKSCKTCPTDEWPGCDAMAVPRVNCSLAPYILDCTATWTTAT